MRPRFLSALPPRVRRNRGQAPLARLWRGLREGNPSPARGLAFGLFLSALLWAAMLGFFLAL